MRITCTILLLLCMCFNADAQDRWIGLKFGGGITNIKTSSYQSLYSSITNYEFGVTYTKPIKSNVTLGVDFMYLQKGATRSWYISSGSFEEILGSYIEVPRLWDLISIPIHLNYHLHNDNKSNLFAGIGLRPSLIINNVKSDQSNDFDLSLNVRVGYQWQLLSHLRISPFVSSELSLFRDTVNFCECYDIDEIFVRHYGFIVGLELTTNL